MTAYGKDRNILRSVGTFRQMAGQFGGANARRAPRAGRPYFIGQYHPPITPSDTIVLLDGQYENMKVDESGERPKAFPVYLPEFQFVDHFDGRTRKSAICSAGPLRAFKDERNACTGCDIFWATLEPGPDGKKKSRMSRTGKFAVSIIDLGVYHKQPQHDFKTGEVRSNPKTGEPYMDWVKCEGTGCAGCRNKVETKFGHNPHWQMSWVHWKTLLEQDREVANSCRSCKGVNTIVSEAWTCTNCGEAAVELATTTLSGEDIIKMTESFHTCKTCKETGFLREEKSCTQCSYGVRMTIFDVALQVRRIPIDDKNSALSVAMFRPIKTSLEALIEELRPKHIPPTTGAELISLLQPKDLRSLFAPTPNKIQLERFGPPPMTAPGAGSPASGPGQHEEPQAREYDEQYQ